ncbi:MAG: thioredoxin family protein [Candidatus Andeanibacterium colombiense]|uniref:Thioredoxin family protein n=1 Tax=Candidatus Andeanibacterium colombiense TaxID=3121345 RepID=A0AAJ6BNG7_9SPHN|nr:MAG: thioredoxin family protein [Sphingomonadaceae bacterium]
MKIPILSSFAAIALLALPAAAPARPAPRISLTSLQKLPQPLPLPYAEAADADRAVAQAKARAKKSGKLLLVDLGGNWCPDCRMLAGVMDLPEMKAFIARHYELVSVDIGRFDKNGQIAAHWGVKKLDGVPALLVVDPKSDKLLNRSKLFALADARSMTPQALADWIAQWV